MCVLCVGFRDQKAQWANFDIWGGGCCTDPLLPVRAKFHALERTHDIRLLAEFRLDRFILSPSGGEKPQFLPVFGLRYLVVSPIGTSLRKLNMGVHVQPQAFPYPTVSKRFCSPKPSWRNLAHTL